jgi:hypothetical protein
MKTERSRQIGRDLRHAPYDLASRSTLLGRSPLRIFAWRRANPDGHLFLRADNFN